MAGVRALKCITEKLKARVRSHHHHHHHATIMFNERDRERNQSQKCAAGICPIGVFVWQERGRR